MPRPMDERLGIAGSGAIATGLAVTAARTADVVLLARSDTSADRARARIERVCSKSKETADPERVTITTDVHALAEFGVTFAVEAVVEELEPKRAVLEALNDALPDSAVVASTTSSLSVASLADASGRAEQFCALHVFNPVPAMALIELAFPGAAGQETRARAHALCRDLDKTAVEVPDIPGFVVNRLLFPFLFSAVRLMETTSLLPSEIDECMTLGAGHPMGPLALLDFVGLDVAVAIGETIGEEIPGTVHRLVADGALGRKSDRGFHDYRQPETPAPPPDAKPPEY